MKKMLSATAAKRHTQSRNGRNYGYSERIESIRTALLDGGVEPAAPELLMAQLPQAQNKFLRFGTVNKPRSKNGSLRAYFDRGLPIVVFAKDWRLGAEVTWTAASGNRVTPRERLEIQRRFDEAQKSMLLEQERAWEEKATIAERLWYSSIPSDPEHPYLVRKGIKPHRARQKGRSLVLLISDFSGKAWSIQTITESGRKRQMAGAKKQGNFLIVESPNNPSRVLLCEGFSTGCTLAELDPSALVIAAVDCGNIKPVAQGVRNYWPSMELIICGDDDRGKDVNRGAVEAKKAALAASARFALPDWPEDAPDHLSDFNDLYNWQRGQK